MKDIKHPCWEQAYNEDGVYSMVPDFWIAAIGGQVETNYECGRGDDTGVPNRCGTCNRA